MNLSSVFFFAMVGLVMLGVAAWGLLAGVALFVAFCFGIVCAAFWVKEITGKFPTDLAKEPQEQSS